jgi:hypothetical protein
MKGMIRLTALSLVALALASCSSGQSDPNAFAATASLAKPQSLVIKGAVSVDAANPGRFKSQCHPASGFSDIHEGADVSVTNTNGKVIALGSLGSGHYYKVHGITKSTTCVFSFIVSDVPVSEHVYGIEVSHRGELKYHRSDLHRRVFLQLG